MRKIATGILALFSVANVAAVLALPIVMALTIPAAAERECEHNSCKKNPAPLIGAGIPVAVAIVGGYFGYRLVKRKRS